MRLGLAAVTAAVEEAAAAWTGQALGNEREVASRHAIALILTDDLGLRIATLTRVLSMPSGTAHRTVELARAKRAMPAVCHRRRSRVADLFAWVYYTARSALGLPEWHADLVMPCAVYEPGIEIDLGHLIGDHRAVSPAAVVSAVLKCAASLSIYHDGVLSGGHSDDESQVRGVLSLLLREEAGLSYPDIARALCLGSHASAHRAVTVSTAKRAGTWYGGDANREHRQQVWSNLYAASRTALGLPAWSGEEGDRA